MGCSAKDRNSDIDILKFIGIMCIILAHVETPTVLNNLRTFDVVLMIYVSALLFFKFGNVRDVKSYFMYIKKRFVKIIIPSWIAIVMILGINIFTNTYGTGLRNIINMFAFNDGVSCLWIIRVYFLLALILPIFKMLFEKYQTITVVVTLLLYILYELAYSYGLFNISLISYIFVHAAPCLLISLVVALTEKQNNSPVYIFICLLVFMVAGIIIFALNGRVAPMEDYKFPFRIYYLSYGLFITELLVFIQKKVRIKGSKYIAYISENSLWIYLFHIMFVMVVNKYFTSLNWLIKYIIIVTGSIIAVIVKNKLIIYKNKLKAIW